MPEKNKSIYTAYFKLLTAIAMWGGSFIATKIAVQDVSAVTVVWLRFLIGSLILGVFAWKKKELPIPSWKDSLEFLWLGFLGITLHQWLQSNGLVTSEASTTAWLVSTAPVFMAILGWMFLKEQLSWKTAVGILLATLGVLLVVTNGDVSSIFDSGFGAPGDVLILISAPNWALFSVLSRPILKRFPSSTVTFYVLLFGWLLTSIQFIFGKHWLDFNQISPAGWISIAFLGVFCSALAYIFYNDGLKTLPSSQVGAFLYLEPFVATLIAAVILSERMAPAALAGGVVIILGVWLVNQNPEKQKDPNA